MAPQVYIHHFKTALTVTGGFINWLLFSMVPREQPCELHIVGVRKTKPIQSFSANRRRPHAEMCLLVSNQCEVTFVCSRYAFCLAIHALCLLLDAYVSRFGLTM